MKQIALSFITLLILTLIFSCGHEPKTERIDISKEGKKIQKNDRQKEVSTYVKDTVLPVFVPLTELPPSTLISDDTIKWDMQNFITSRKALVVRKERVMGIPKLYEHNYSFDTTIYNCKMRLVVHRLSKFEIIDDVLLSEVNFLIEFLTDRAPYIYDKFGNDEILDMGDMHFYDDVEKVENEFVSYRRVYGYWSGGGSSVKDNELKKIPLKMFNKLIDMPHSSEEFYPIWSTFVAEEEKF